MRKFPPLSPADLPIAERTAWSLAQAFARNPSTLRANGYADLADFIRKESEAIERRLQAWEVKE